MKKVFLLAAILMGGTLSFVGCGGGDDNKDPATTVVVVTNAPAPVVTNAPDANALFAAITPANVRLGDKFTIVGHGTVYTLRCDAIAGAASYTFTTSFGASQTVAAPTVSVQKAGVDEEFTLSVYATNGNGINTRTASATVN